MNATTRNALFSVLILMTVAMFYGSSIGTTPDYKAVLATVYGAIAGFASCVFLLAVLPLISVARRQMQQGQPQTQVQEA